MIPLQGPFGSCVSMEQMKNELAVYQLGVAGDELWQWWILYSRLGVDCGCHRKLSHEDESKLKLTVIQRRCFGHGRGYEQEN